MNSELTKCYRKEVMVQLDSLLRLKKPFVVNMYAGIETIEQRYTKCRHRDVQVIDSRRDQSLIVVCNRTLNLDNQCKPTEF